MKTVMVLASEVKLGVLYKCTKVMVPLRNALIKMGWLQAKLSIKTDNSVADTVVNHTIVPHKLKSMDMRLHWLCCREVQGQLQFFGHQERITGGTTT